MLNKTKTNIFEEWFSNPSNKELLRQLKYVGFSLAATEEEITKSSNTKFLIITHHRMTMARVNRLFGVTMPEQGVSQLVSVELEEAENFKSE